MTNKSLNVDLLLVLVSIKSMWLVNFIFFINTSILYYQQILGVSTYVQTVTAESSAKLFHINKENWGRLVKLASNMGHTVSAPTISAMTQMACTTWTNRLEKFTSTSNDLACLDSMVKELLNQPTMRYMVKTIHSENQLTLFRDFIDPCPDSYLLL